MIVVDETRRALGRLGAAYRREFDPVVIAVAGSNGKTTTKELIASVLRQKKTTLWSEASFNNDIGVPLTLLRLERSHQAAVLEAGTNHPGELAPLLKMMSPRMGVVTNIAREHLEFFHDLVGVAREEGTLAECLPSDGVLFLNGDNPWSEIIARRTRARVVLAGLDRSNDWVAREVRADENGAAFFVECRHPAWAGEYRVRLLGRHQVINALLALAVGAEMGLSREEIQRGLLACAPGRNAPATVQPRRDCRCWTTATTPTRTRCWRRCRPCASCPARDGGWRCWATWPNWAIAPAPHTWKSDGGRPRRGWTIYLPLAGGAARLPPPHVTGD